MNEEKYVEEVYIKLLASLPEKYLKQYFKNEPETIARVQEYIDNFKEFPIKFCKNLDPVVATLINAKRTGLNYKANFNGIWLYSSNINEDDAYIKVYGCTKYNLKKEAYNDYINSVLKEKNEIINAYRLKDSRIEKGLNYVSINKAEALIYYVNNYTEIGANYFLDLLLDCLKMIHDNESADDVANYIKEKFNGEINEKFKSLIFSLMKLTDIPKKILNAYNKICENQNKYQIKGNNDYLKEVERFNRLSQIGCTFTEASDFAELDLFYFPVIFKDKVLNTFVYGKDGKYKGYYFNETDNKKYYIYVDKNDDYLCVEICENHKYSDGLSYNGKLKNKMAILHQIIEEDISFESGSIVVYMKKVNDLNKLIEIDREYNKSCNVTKNNVLKLS